MQRPRNLIVSISLAAALGACTADSPIGQSFQGALADLGLSGQQGSNGRAAQASNSSSVASAQSMLNGLGYAAGPVDGQYGAKTADAIRAFQRDNGLRPDGRVTPNLITALSNRGDGNLNAAAAPRLQNNDVRAGATTGAIGGAAVGFGASKVLGTNAQTGMLLGTVAGGAAGAAAGKITEGKRNRYNQDLATIDQGIRSQEQKVAGLSSEISTAATKAEARQAEIEALVRRAEQGEDVIEETRQLSEQLNVDIENREKLTEDTRVEIKLIEKKIEDVENVVQAGAEQETAMAERRDQLAAQRDKLQASLNTLSGIETELEEQRQVLSSKLNYKRAS